MSDFSNRSAGPGATTQTMSPTRTPSSMGGIATLAPVPTPVLSVSPVVLPAPARPVELQVRVSAPVSGTELPIILLSHGLGFSNHLSSLDGYAPLANYWAAHGFVVIQPTHLDSRTLGLDQGDPGVPPFWRARAEDMSRILDQLDAIEAAVPQLAGRLDPSRVAVAGHSMGGHTASVLLGARHTDLDNGREVNLAEPRIKAGVLLAAPGRGDTLSEYAAEHYPFFSTIDFSTMTTPALVIAGDKDESRFLTVSGAAWHADPYSLAPSPKSLVTLVDAEHGLGGVSGYDVAETTDENPERVALVQLLTWAYLRTELYPDDPAWPRAQHELTRAARRLGRVESK